MRYTHFFKNTGGLNTSDSEFHVANEQATGGFNFEYTLTGGVVKTRGKLLTNTTADAQLKSLGIMLHEPASGGQTVIRAAGTKLQTYNLDTNLFTNQAEDDTTATTDFLTSGSTQQVIGNMFTTGTNDILWMSGGGMDRVYGYTGSQITENGSDAPTGTLGAVVSTTGGSFSTTGTLYYALVLRKLSTQALSNAALDVVAVIANTTDKVTLTFPSVDSTKYDKWYIYRSAFGGATTFTTGDLIAQVDTADATYVDLGNVAVSTSQVVPRAGGTTDNSVLPTGTIKYSTNYRQQYVVAKNSTVYFSDLNKPESWPIDKTITIPEGGEITALGVLGFNSPITSNLNEYLVVFQQQNMWIITGSGSLDSATGIYDFILRKIDSIGCANQSLVQQSNGFLWWLDWKGIFAWNGAGKPIYVSHPIEDKFEFDGILDKANLAQGWATALRRKNHLIWTVPHRSLGINKYRIKLDLNLTIPQITQNAAGTMFEGVFMQDKDPVALYAGMSYRDNSTKAEILLAGDAAGFLYKMYNSTDDNGENIEFSYDTKAFDMDTPGMSKTFYKVVVWLDQSVPKDLTMYYWANYQFSDSARSEVADTMDAANRSTGSLWDLARWDISNWDEFEPTLKSISFNLSGDEGNNNGDCLKLRFIQNDVDAPVTIHGFTVYWDENALRK